MGLGFCSVGMISRGNRVNRRAVKANSIASQVIEVDGVGRRVNAGQVRADLKSGGPKMKWLTDLAILLILYSAMEFAIKRRRG